MTVYTLTATAADTVTGKTGTGTASFTTGPASMPAPAGYATRLFGDQFPGTALSAGNWVTYLGAEGIRWDNQGRLPLPYSGSNAGGFNLEMYSPAQVAVSNGVTLTAQPNTGTYAGTYPWVSGIITTEGKFALPVTTPWYVQVKARMPDMTTGMWPAIWFLRGPAGSPDNEIDLFEGGFTGGPGAVNQVMHCDFFADQGEHDALIATGSDLSAGYHVYGLAFIPGVSVTGFFDGTRVWQVLASGGVTIAAEPYQIMIQLQVAAPAASGWHVTAGPGTPASALRIAEVQAWAP